MKLIIASTVIALGFSGSALAAQPVTDHSQHQQHQQQTEPAPARESQPSAAQAAAHGNMQHHQGMGEGMGEGMKMEGCCCCKKDAQGKMSCDEKAAAPAAEGHDHSKH